MTSTAETFHIKEFVQATEADKVVFERHWDHAIKRDLMWRAPRREVFIVTAVAAGETISLARRWYVLVVLTGVYALSIADRS